MKCLECGKRRFQRLRQWCDLCAYWRRHVEAKDHPDVARIEGRHYVIGPSDAPEHDRGSDGQRYVVVFLDGRRVETFNLWRQGEIPGHFRARLPDNARFEDGT